MPQPVLELVWAQDCLEMESIGDNLQGLPEGSHAIEGPRVQRQVGALALVSQWQHADWRPVPGVSEVVEAVFT